MEIAVSKEYIIDGKVMRQYTYLNEIALHSVFFFEVQKASNNI